MRKEDLPVRIQRLMDEYAACHKANDSDLRGQIARKLHALGYRRINPDPEGNIRWIPIDLAVLVCDETEFIDAEWAKENGTRKVYWTYLFDRGEVTYPCSMMYSYALHSLRPEIMFHPGFGDPDGEIFSELADGDIEDILYRNADEVDAGRHGLVIPIRHDQYGDGFDAYADPELDPDVEDDDSAYDRFMDDKILKLYEETFADALDAEQEPS